MRRDENAGSRTDTHTYFISHVCALQSLPKELVRKKEKKRSQRHESYDVNQFHLRLKGKKKRRTQLNKRAATVLANVKEEVIHRV